MQAALRLVMIRREVGIVMLLAVDSGNGNGVEKPPACVLEHVRLC